MPLTSTAPLNYIQDVEIASRTLIAADSFRMLYANNGTLIFTVPPDIFGNGVQISLCDFDGGVPLFAPGVGVTINTAGTLGPTAQFSVASIIRVPADLVAGDINTWICVGNV